MTPFRLQKVLEYRHSLENLAKLSLAKAQNRQVAIESEIQQTLKQKQELQCAVRTRQEDVMDAREIPLFEARIQHLKRRSIVLAEELQQACLDTLARRQELVQAAQKKKALERLKEKKIEEEALSRQRRDTAVLDEIAGQKHWRSPS